MQYIASHTGIVVKNAGRGKDLGYPTANIEYKGNLDDGVYISHVSIPGIGDNFPALTFIGAPISFDDPTRRMESYILNFDKDIYSKKIKVDLIKHTRGNMKFDSLEALISQMDQDEQEARRYFAALQNN